MKSEYDLIASLGGNCAAAAQLRMRGLRPCSLPFDWLYMESAKTVDWLARGFADGFSDFCLKGNLVPIAPGASAVSGTAPYKYVDSASGYGFIHHFKESIDSPGGYEAVYAVLSRRVARLADMFKKADRVLFVLATNFAYDLSAADRLVDAMRGLYPGKKIDFRIMQFNASFDDARIAEEGRSDRYSWGLYKRGIMNYDFNMTSAEWSFLDEISLKGVSQRPLRGLEKIRYKIWKNISKHFLNTGAGLKGMSFRHGGRAGVGNG